MKLRGGYPQRGSYNSSSGNTKRSDPFFCCGGFFGQSRQYQSMETWLLWSPHISFSAGQQVIFRSIIFSIWISRTMPGNTKGSSRGHKSKYIALQEDRNSEGQQSRGNSSNDSWNQDHFHRYNNSNQQWGSSTFKADVNSVTSSFVEMSDISSVFSKPDNWGMKTISNNV